MIAGDAALAKALDFEIVALFRKPKQGEESYFSMTTIRVLASLIPIIAAVFARPPAFAWGAGGHP